MYIKVHHLLFIEMPKFQHHPFSWPYFDHHLFVQLCTLDLNVDDLALPYILETSTYSSFENFSNYFWYYSLQWQA